jgi:hypothetical protein
MRNSVPGAGAGFEVTVDVAAGAAAAVGGAVACGVGGF